MNKNSKILESEEQEKELFAELIDKYFYCSFGCSTEGEMKVREKEWKLLIEIFYSFTKVIPEKIDELITFTLKQIGEFETIDRCCVIRVSKDGSAMRNTHIWRKAGISDDFFFLWSITNDSAPWWMAKVRNLDIINIPSVANLPPEAQKEKDALQAGGIKSILVVPIIYEKKLLGYLGFDSLNVEKPWSEHSQYLLNVLADIFSGALNRKEQALALKESESYYQSIFENTGTVMFIVNEDLKMLKSNRNREGIFGFTIKEVENKKWMELLPENEKELIKGYHTLRMTGATQIPNKYITHIKNKSGKIRECLNTVELITGTKNSVISLVDITQYNRLSKALKAISAINALQLHARDEQSLLEEVCHKIADLGGYRFVWVGCVDKNPEQTMLPVACAGYEEGNLSTLNVVCIGTEPFLNLAGEAIKTRRPVICHTTATDPWFTLCREEELRRGYKAVIAIPLCIEEKSAAGVLVICSEDEAVFDTDEVRLLREMADDLVFGIKYLRTKVAEDMNAKKLKTSLENMRKLLFETVDTLTILTEERDPYTAGHQKKVAFLAAEIAKEMGLSAIQIEGVAIAGSVHDIGKIAIPSEILSKPGKISKIEFELIKTHSKVGYDIIKNIEFPWPVADIILQHHERIDGSGYPQGLKGEAICLGARIIAVADVVEAMSSYRPYRAALGVEKALEEIERMKNKDFDPKVVDACLNLFKNKGFVFP